MRAFLSPSDCLLIANELNYNIPECTNIFKQDIIIKATVRIHEFINSFDINCSCSDIDISDIINKAIVIYCYDYYKTDPENSLNKLSYEWTAYEFLKMNLQSTFKSY